MTRIYHGLVEKDHIRDSVRRRGAIDPATGFLVSSGLFVWLSGRLPGTITAYLAMPDEVDVATLFDRLPGWRWVLPRVEDDGHLTFRDRAVPRETHRFGMEQPIDQGAATPIHEIDVFLVPGLAFDANGARLGRGAGYYDRVLAQARTDAEAVGVTVDSRILEAIPFHDHDRRVDWLATESGVSACSPKR